jgi:hypothetical protein
MVITRRGMARPDGSPKDVDREFATLFMLMWMFHCHVDEHMEAGMTAMYQVLP